MSAIDNARAMLKSCFMLIPSVVVEINCVRRVRRTLPLKPPTHLARTLLYRHLARLLQSSRPVLCDLELLRLDRLDRVTLTVDGRPCMVERPEWLLT